ncbi:MAG: hypothetical protein QMD77_02795 [Patescibacteria group bacterium]|nr:hypothetical protein [Patescibacteria group bacterium]
MFSAKKQKGICRHARFIALVLVFAVFASTCLLPVSEAKAQGVRQAKNAGSAAGKVWDAVTKTWKKAPTGKTTAKSTGGTAAKVGTSSWLGTVISVLVIWGLVEGFLALAKAFVDYMISPNPDLYNLNSSFIQAGWKMIRDVCNLFFLLALLFIAFCTILQIEKYNAKKNLLTLILMALLINFSKPIAVFIFDGSQLLMQWFLKGTGEAGNITNTLGVYAGIGSVLKSAVTHSSILSGGADLLFGIIFLFIFDVALFCLGLFLLIRIVAVWILVIVSPVAFFAMILPDFKKLATQWWDALFRYCYVGPAIAFFLWLASRMRSIQSQLTSGSLADAHPMQQMPIFIPYMITIVFLFAALMMANQFGIHFSQAITKGANRFMKFIALGGLKMLERTNLVARPSETLLGRALKLPQWATLSPRSVIEAWKKTSAEADRQTMEPVISAVSDKLNQVFRRKKPEDYLKNVQFESDIEKYAKEQKNISVQDTALIAVIEKYKNDYSQEARARTAAALRLLFENNDQNEFMKQYILKNEETRRGVAQMMGITESELMKRGNDPDTLRNALHFALARNKMDPGQIGRQLFQLGNIALPKGNFGNYGMGIYDEATESYIVNNKPGEQIKYAKAKAKNIDVQEKIKRLHWNAIFGELQDGGTGELHETGKAILRDMKAAEIKQLNRARPDFIERIYRDQHKLQAYANDTSNDLNAEERANIHAFINKVKSEFIATPSSSTTL